MDLIERRAILATTPNPDKGLDYIITLEGHLPTNGGHSRRHITLRYVPDKTVLDARSFGAYLEALAASAWPTPEDLAVTILSDINNEIVARWVQVNLHLPELLHHAVETHAVNIEDRQPGWDNRLLIERLKLV